MRHSASNELNQAISWISDDIDLKQILYKKLSFKC